MKKVLWVLLLLPLFLTGCYEKMVTKSYDIKTTYTAYIGDVILSEEVTMDTGIATAKLSKFELLYNGKVGNTINITYREYYGYTPQNSFTSRWLVKDGFTQQLNYDLDNSKIINYKGRVIEILEINSDNSIAFMVQ